MGQSGPVGRDITTGRFAGKLPVPMSERLWLDGTSHAAIVLSSVKGRLRLFALDAGLRAMADQKGRDAERVPCLVRPHALLGQRSNTEQRTLEEVALSLVRPARTLDAFGLGLGFGKFRDPLRSFAAFLEPPASLKLQQRVFKLVDISLPPKHHVPENDRRGKSGNTALARSPEGYQAHAKILSDHLLRHEVFGKFHWTR